MNDLINIKNENGQLLVSSREVARNFEKRHSHVVEAIESKIQNLTTEKSEVEISDLFIKDEYEHRGNFYKEYLLTRDGFSFMVMGFTGAKADSWKLKYIEVFNKMEAELSAPKKLSPMDQLKLQYQVLDEHEERLSYLEDNMTIDFGQQQRLQSMAKSRVVKILGGIESPAYRDRSISSKVFSAVWKDYKDYFMLASYRDTAKVDFAKALGYLENWTLHGRILREIEVRNKQIGLDEVIQKSERRLSVINDNKKVLQLLQ